MHESGARMQGHHSRKIEIPVLSANPKKLVAAFRASNIFEPLAREWWETKRDGWSISHKQATLHRLEKELFPSSGGRPVSEIEAPKLLRRYALLKHAAR
jgi:hypothetical protein